MVCEDGYKLKGCGNCKIYLTDKDILKNLHVMSIAQIAASLFQISAAETKVILPQHCVIKCDGIPDSIATGDPIANNSVVDANKMAFEAILADWYRAQGNRGRDLDMRLVATYITKFKLNEKVVGETATVEPDTINYIRSFALGLVAQLTTKGF
jgi:hypothetical protein